MGWLDELELGEAVELLELIEEENFKERMWPVWARSGSKLSFDEYCDACRRKPVQVRESEAILADVDAMMGGV